MASLARSGRILSRSLRYISSSSSSLSRNQFTQLRTSQTGLRIPSPSIRLLSSYPRFQNQALARQEDAQDAPPEITQFSELAEEGIVDRTVIQNITGKMKIHTMTPVQQMTINECLDGTDVIAQAKTGTGKTLAFLIPIVQRLLREADTLDKMKYERARANDIRALIISPTRELAEQIAVEARKIVDGTPIKVQTAVGGTQKSYHLQLMQKHGCHILVGTPGRVNDILSDPHSGVKLDNIQTFVMDEADRLLDIGFTDAIREIESYMPSRKEHDRQTLMFSATVPKSVVSLVRESLRPDFKFIRTVDPDEIPTHENVPQKIVYLPALQNLMPAILEIATNAIEAHKKDPQNNMPFKAIVYFASLNEVSLAYNWLENLRDPDALNQRRTMFNPHPLSPCQIHMMSSKLDQRQRTRNSESFRRAESAILCSSDVTARGMDFPNVSHVIQVGMPKTTDDYIHRIGRTGRAGKPGQGWLIMSEDERREWQYNYAREMKYLKEDTSLRTASLDMTQGAQLPANLTRLLQMVETGIRAVPYPVKQQAYASMIAVMGQRAPRTRKQDVVDAMNDLSRFGWGMERPPTLTANLAGKLGVAGCNGLEIADGRRDDNDFGDRRGAGGGGGGGRYGSGGGGFGGRGGNSGFGNRDRGTSRRDAFDDFEDTSAFGRSNQRSSGSGRGGTDGFGGRGRGGGSSGGGFGGRTNDRRDQFRDRL